MKNCNLCGNCNLICPVFRLHRKETRSNRNKAFICKEGTPTSEAYSFLLDGSIKTACPAGIDVDEVLIKLRSHLILRGRETPANKELIDNLRRYKTPYGKKRKDYPGLVT
ncbi:MAG: hypothetical protein ABIJ21_01270 [Nanoarchaeota archaeon]